MSAPSSSPSPFAEAAPVVLWRGAPRASAYVTRRLWPAFPVALVTLAVGATWEYLAVTGHHLIVYPLLGWLLPVLGLYGVIVHPVRQWRAARRTVYEVSEAGLRVSWGGRVQDGYVVAPAALPPARLVAARGGDDIWLDGPPERISHWGWWQTADDRPVMSCLADAGAALLALAQLRERAGRAGTAPGAWVGAAATPVLPPSSPYDRSPD